jgi:DNA-binding protein HU-beta
MLGGHDVNKTDLVKAVAQKADMTQKDAEKAINSVFAAIEEALANDDKVQIIGFGTFEVKTREERKGRNPQTGNEITIPASKNPVFKAGKGLKDIVNA